VQGLGASLSPAIGGWIAHGIGFSSTFLLLGSLCWYRFYYGCFFQRCLNLPAITNLPILSAEAKKQNGN